jgi:hypothetical protein
MGSEACGSLTICCPHRTRDHRKYSRDERSFERPTHSARGDPHALQQAQAQGPGKDGRLERVGHREQS